MKEKKIEDKLAYVAFEAINEADVNGIFEYDA